VARLLVRGIGRRFGGLPAVDDVHLDVEPGQIVALIGPNGAGKTTLLSLIAGLIRPTRCGAMTFDGRDLQPLAVHERRRAGIATVRQTPHRFGSMTVREEVAIGARFAGRPRPGRREAADGADDALERVGLIERAEEPVTSLNLNETRRLALATALAGRPRLLLLDEPMAGLTVAEVDEKVALLRRLRAVDGVTLLWVEHVMPAVDALADRVVAMDVGRIIADGTPAAVRRDPAVVSAYLGTGAGGGEHA
jgi:branched-chain amino acid transport system ATP-binding protein